MKITFKVEGLSDLDKALAELPKAYAKNILRKAWAQAAQPMLDDIKAHAPVLTGQLRDSIEVVRMPSEGRTEASMQIGVLGEFYGHFQEFGTPHQPARPFVRPAVDRGSRDLVERFRKIVGESIQRSTSRSAKAARTARLEAIFTARANAVGKALP